MEQGRPVLYACTGCAANRSIDPDNGVPVAESVFGGDLKARHSKAQRREAAIGCHILNRMAELGRPSSYALGR